MKIKFHIRLNILALILIFLNGFTGRGDIINFETVQGNVPVEGMVVSNQFQPYFGVRFSGLRTNDVPIIAKKGFPQSSFNTAFGQDSLDPTESRFNEIGDFFLGVNRATGYPWGLTLFFDAPVSNFTFYALDLDGNELITITAYPDDSDTNALISRVYASNSNDGPQPPDRGSGKTTLVAITATNQSQLFTKVNISIPNMPNSADNFGFDCFAFDFADNYTPSNPGPSTVSLQTYPGLTIQGEVGWKYRIDYADKIDITPGQTNWHVLTNLFLPASPYLFLDTNSSANSQRFYRAVTAP